MNSYSGDQKGFIYAACDPARQDEVVSRYLEPLEKDGAAFCLYGGGSGTEALSRKEDGNIAKSNAVLLFLTRDFASDKGLRDIVSAAVSHGKSLLCVYLEDVELDSALSMQTESQQALHVSKFKSDEDLLQALRGSSIFENVQVTEAQKKAQKSRTLIAVMAAAVILIAAVLIIKPMLGSESSANAETMEALGLAGLSQEELESVKKLRIVGNDILDSEARAFYDGGTDTVYYYPLDAEGHENGAVQETEAGTISDLSGIQQLTNLRTLYIEGQQIEDASPIFEVENIYNLSLSCNPVSSLDGLENLTRLETLYIEYTDVTELPNGAHPTYLFADGSKLAKVPDFGGKKNVILEAEGAPLTDLANLGTAANYDRLIFDAGAASSKDVADELKKISVSRLTVCDLDISSLKDLSGISIDYSLDLIVSPISSLDGAEELGTHELRLIGCYNLKDLSPVNDMPNLQKLIISSDLEYLADAVDDSITVEIDEGGDSPAGLAADIERYLEDNWDGDSRVGFDTLGKRLFVRISDGSGSIEESRLSGLAGDIRDIIDEADLQDEWRLTISYVKQIDDEDAEPVLEIAE